MAAPFYTLNHVQLSFTVTDCCGAVCPISAAVNVFDPCDVQVVTAAVATILANLVSYTVACCIHCASGNYIAEFDVTLPCCEVRTHPIVYKILVRPSVA